MYLNDNIKRPAFKIDSGLFEPIHLLKKETDLLTKGIAETLTNCAQEIGYFSKLFYDRTRQVSEALFQQQTQIE